MRRALAGLGAGALLLAGCSTVTPADDAACDLLFGVQEDADDDDPAALRQIVDELGGARDSLSADLRPSIDTVVSDAERLSGGGRAKYFSVHIDEALSICMDVGW